MLWTETTPVFEVKAWVQDCVCVCGLHANDEAVVPSVGERGKRSNTAHVGDVTQERLCSRRNTISHFPFRITDVRKHIIIQTKGAVLQTLLKTIETITEIQMVSIKIPL